jgi:hypothetical protein
MSDQEDDWRLGNQADWLQGVEVRRTEYKQPSKEWDHDHCEFCWAKFTEHPYSEEPTLQVGYVAGQFNHWICEKCFGDFRERFQWRVIDDDSTS